ncbi:MAG: DMT family transporter [archaeon]
MSQKISLSLLLAGPLIASIEVILANWLMKRGIDPIFFTFLSLLFAGIILAPFHLKELVASFSKGGRALKILIAVFVFRAAGDFLFFFAQKYSSPINYSFLSQFAVVFTAIIAYFALSERLTFREILFGLVMVVGAGIIVTGGRLDAPSAGDLLTLLFAFFVAAASILLKVGEKAGMSYNSYLVGGMFFSAAAGLVLIPFYGRVPANLAEVSLYALIEAVLIVALTKIVLILIERIGPSKTNLVFILSAVFTPLISAAVLSEIIRAHQLFGGGILVAGAVLFFREEGRVLKKELERAKGKKKK